MNIEKLFHMKGGQDETSYSTNSFIQKMMSDKGKRITLEAVEEVYLSKTPEILSMADLGCGSGRNSLSMIRDLYHVVDEAHRNMLRNGQKSAPAKLSSVSVYLNDLPTNDFNSIFRALPDFLIEEEVVNSEGVEGHPRPSLFVAASPGSFYNRIFPPNFLHFIYSSQSLHWLSKVPPGIYDEHGNSINKGSIYISERSPPIVIQAYVQQFKEDFSRFLHLRSQELTPGGRMVLLFMGRKSPDHFDRGIALVWELLARSLALLISKGQVEEEKLNSYDLNFYAPSKEEIEEEAEKEGSLKIVKMEILHIEKEMNERVDGKVIASHIRAILEPMIIHHFGEEILVSLFSTFAQLVNEEKSKAGFSGPATFLLSLSKI